MINGLIIPTQMRLDKMPSMEATSKVGSDANTGEFGLVLASLTANSSIAVPTLNEPKFSNEDLVELLQVTSVEELIGLLEEIGQAHKELPELMDDHLIFHDDKLLGWLAEIIPNLNQSDKADEIPTFGIGGLMNAVSLRELLEQLEALGPEILASFEQGIGGRAHLSQDEAITLVAVLKMVAIEGPKLDLTLRQEQQLYSLQGMLKILGEALNVSTEKAQPTRTSTLPFMETNVTNQIKVQASELTGQSVTHSILTATRLDGGDVVNGTQQNSRAEELLRELQNVLKRSNLGQTGGTNRISVRLYPEHLGQLRIELLQTNGVLTARILASSALGKEMLENHLHQLRNTFFQQNIQVERIEISQMLNETPQHEREQSFGQQFKQEQENSNEQKSDQSDEGHMTFEEYMIQLEV
ncbi:flagellar hook-length control protein FliK [Sporosarcina ureilytica]|uniref:Flagellar hook-length control protein-like C-terminal domain-containing protein n=1 Tax=Sporosarcina ureilytica TaxID=298596 RepID=A0A1D8JHU3_9BACL|nr:flagellar hook-length control protein FliK [Sporosarcina ureilytica]AOV08266.1 hypothetical protein BI350_12480 [Sporosarcina ureilytica]